MSRQHTYVALLRGINVGGHRKVRMSDLSTWCSGIGCEDVRTYIQSGNVLFTHGSLSGTELERALEVAIAAQTGFDVKVMVRTAQEMKVVKEREPFPGADPAFLSVGFLREKPAREAVAKLSRTDWSPEEAAIIGREIYLHLPNGMGRTKLGQALDRLGTPVTVRNWRTVLTLTGLANERGRAQF